MRRSLAFALIACTTCFAPLPAVAEPTGAVAPYRKPVLAVMQAAEDPYAGRLDMAVEGLKRFHFLPIPTNRTTSLPAFLAQVREAAKAAGHGDAPLYALVPTHQFGTITSTTPDREEKVEDGLIKSTVYSYLQCPFTFAVDIYDVATGTHVDRIAHVETLQRRYEYHYDDHTPDRAIAAKADELSIRLTRDASVGGARAFDSEAGTRLLFLLPQLMLDLRSLSPFQLKAQIMSWEAGRDRLTLNLGRDVDVHPGDGFTVKRNGAEIGFVRLNRVEADRSEAKPIMLDRAVEPGDTLEERPKFNNWQGLKVGAIWMGGPALMGTLGGEIDFGPYLELLDWYGTGDVSLVTNGAFSGKMGELGVVKKHFWHRWGVYYGLKLGAAQVDGLTGQAYTFGGSLAGGLNAYITPDFVWVTDLALQAYTPLWQRGGTGDGTMVQPLGPMLRTGVSYIF